MRVEAEKERTANPLLPAVAADGLADREHVPFVEGLLERRPAMARSAEGDALGWHRGIGDLGVVGRDQLGDVEQHRLQRRMARERTDLHGVRSAAAAASTHQRTRPLEGAIACAGNSSGRRGPSSTRRRMPALAPPETRNKTSAAALITAGVRVILHTDAAGARAAITQRVRSSTAALPGKSDAVCPSSPSPRRTRSMSAPAGVWSKARSVAS